MKKRDVGRIAYYDPDTGKTYWITPQNHTGYDDIETRQNSSLKAFFNGLRQLIFNKGHKPIFKSRRNK